MNRRRSILLTLVALLVLVPLVLMMWPEGPLDLSKDEEPFRSMVLPPKSLKGSCWMDGGSVSVEVIDHEDGHHEITFPIGQRGSPTPYNTAYNGAFRDSEQMIPLKDPARAKEIIIRLLKDYGRKDDKYLQGVLYSLSGQLPSVPVQWILRIKELFQ